MASELTKVKVQLLTNQIESRRRAGFVITLQPSVIEVTEEELAALNADSFIGVTAASEDDVVNQVGANSGTPETTLVSDDNESEDESEEDDSEESEDEEETEDEGDDAGEGEESSDDAEKPAVPSKNVLLRKNSLAQLKELAQSHGLEVTEESTKPALADAIIAKLSEQ